MKILASLLGPTGVGLMGLLINVMETTAQVFGIGLASSGTKKVGEIFGQEDQKKLVTTRRALVWGTCVLGITAGTVLFLCREMLAEAIFKDAGIAPQIGWLAIGVALSIAAQSHSAVLAGTQQLASIAKMQIFSGLFSVLVGLSLIWLMGESGLIFFILTTPVASFFLGHFFVSKLPSVVHGPIPLRDVLSNFRAMGQLGLSVMISGMITSVSFLVIRGLIQNELGSVPQGYFQAAWGISTMYLGFVLAVLGTDFFPKLSGMYPNKTRARRFVNDQTEIALLIAAPLILFLGCCAHLIIPILYTPEFAPAVDVLRWMVIADAIRIVTFPKRFVIIASARGALFFFTELFAALTFVGFVILLIPRFGLEGVGIAYLCRYLGYLPLVYFISRKLVELRWGKQLARPFYSLFFLVVVSYSAFEFELISGVFSSLFVFATFTAVFYLTALTGQISANPFSIYSAIKTKIDLSTQDSTRRIGDDVAGNTYP